MKKELQDKLYEKYPKIFIEKDLPMNQSCMCWGIKTGNGWYGILDRLCQALQYSTDTNGHPQVVANQVKEKFASLRFYTTGEDEYQYGLINMAENMTEITCENCGVPARRMTSDRGRVIVLCNKCFKEIENER